MQLFYGDGLYLYFMVFYEWVVVGFRKSHLAIVT